MVETPSPTGVHYMSCLIARSSNLDYATFSIPNITTLNEAFAKFEFKFQELGYGNQFYKNKTVSACRSISIFWEGRTADNAGYCVEIKGAGMRLMEAMTGFTSWEAWLSSWVEMGAKFSRLDLAIDDTSGSIKYRTVAKAVLKKTAVFRSRRAREYKDINFDTGQVGRTLYVGSRQSESMMRCYDKGVESGEGRSWLRFEFEFKGDRAQALALSIIKDGFDAARGCVRSVIEFKEEGAKDLNRTRQEVASWWKELVDSAKYRLDVKKAATKTLEQLHNWYVKFMAPMEAALTVAFGEEYNFREASLQAGLQRLSERHRIMIAGAQMQLST